MNFIGLAIACFAMSIVGLAEGLAVSKVWKELEEILLPLTKFVLQ